MREKEPVPETGKDEMNLVEYPITLLSKRHEADVKTLKFSDNIIGDKGELINREWTVTGSAEYGLPLASDNDVLIALMVIGKEQSFQSRQIFFSRYRLLKIMQWKDTGENYRRVEGALDRFKGVSIKASNALWDNVRKGYVTKNFGIIDSYELFDSKHREAHGQEYLPFSYVRLSEELFESIKAGYIKSINVKTYYGLESSITKRLYRYLDKKRYDGKKKFEMDLFTLAYIHIGFDEKVYKYASDIKRKLNNAHEELIKTGFLKNAEYQKTSDGSSEKVIYTFGKKTELAESDAVSPGKKEKTFREPPAQVDDPLLARILEIGVTSAMARKIFKEFSREVIQAQVDALPHRDAKDRPAALISAIREGWSLPGAFQEAEARKKRDEEEKLLQEQKKRQEAELKSRVAEYLAKLSNDEMAELRKEAAEIAKSEGTAIFRDRKVSEHVLRGYVHVIVEKRLAVCV